MFQTRERVGGDGRLERRLWRPMESPWRTAGSKAHPVHVARTLESAHDADIAETLNAIDPGAAARVLAALPFDQAVRTLNQPAPFVATLVDVSGLVIYFTMAYLVLHGTLL